MPVNSFKTKLETILYFDAVKIKEIIISQVPCIILTDAPDLSL